MIGYADRWAEMLRINLRLWRYHHLRTAFVFPVTHCVYGLSSRFGNDHILTLLISKTLPINTLINTGLLIRGKDASVYTYFLLLLMFLDQKAF